MFNLKTLGLCLLLALIQGAIFIGIQTSITGALTFPLDDSYIHLQYAKQIARGAYFQYQDGDPISTGATSILYVHVLALGYFIGFRDTFFPVWTLLLALLSIAFIFYLLIQISKKWQSPFAACTSVGLTFFSGILAWGFWSGMEISLFSMLLILTFFQLIQTNGARFPLFFSMGFLSLCRPEGAILGLILFTGVIVHDCLQKGGFKRLFHWASLLSVLFFLACCFLPNLLFRLSTGQWGGSGLSAKSLLHNPIMTAPQKFSAFVDNLFSLSAFLTGFLPRHGSEFMLPGLLLFVVIGFIGLILKHFHHSSWKYFLFGVGLMIVFTAIATLEVWPMHNYRYLLPFYPLLFLLGAMGIESLSVWIFQRSLVMQISLTIVALLISLIYYPVWISRFAENATTIYQKQGRVSHWLAKNLPDQSVIAINDAGVLTYYGDILEQKRNKDQHIVDLVGLVTNGPSQPYRMGEGGLYEWMQHLPDERRPRYAAVFPSWFLEMSRIYDVFYQPQVAFPDPFDPNFSKKIFLINWNYDGMEENPREAIMRSDWVIRDRLDVGDLISEREHNYILENRDHRYPEIPVPFRRNFGYHEEIDERWPDIENEIDELIPVLRRDGSIYQYDILDAGRRITGEESFLAKNMTPLREAWLIFRTCDGSGDFPLFRYRMNVHVNDQFIQVCEPEGTPWNWYEFVVKIPADLIQNEQVQIKIINQGTARFTYYDSFYYWIVQRD
ncbi:MAG: hypothetical protein JXR73_05095 [Candidatus Omnitrophica bacterium]|nr:hypothetical protein [Candidatus Omnitrophota bacterium]